ncbi:hypothetical protein BLNAU_5273 [Blattamonas nauphoetae]|uniref:Uncharacterized protein n=1 Tax=Blattamonas nauphoetae TaxID=2049346 RepID=A0ABQ9Y7X6_9EUKA|nr:hypothetical protein BLNAU_5273 [Blattamonas nauphoetae]
MDGPDFLTKSSSFVIGFSTSQLSLLLDVCSDDLRQNSSNTLQPQGTDDERSLIRLNLSDSSEPMQTHQPSVLKDFIDREWPFVISHVLESSQFESSLESRDHNVTVVII